MFFLDVKSKVFPGAIEFFSIYIANKTLIISIISDSLFFFSSFSKGIYNYTRNNSCHNHIYSQSIEKIPDITSNSRNWRNFPLWCSRIPEIKMSQKAI
jgi:hypothetical protein